jgi:lysozyme-like protein
VSLKQETVTIAPQPIPAPVVGCDLVNNYPWDTATARAVCMAESGGDPNAYGVNTNGTSDAGLLQINSIHIDLISLDDRFNPTLNVAAAYEIYKGSGWRAWSVFNNGRYLKFL